MTDPHTPRVWTAIGLYGSGDYDMQGGSGGGRDRRARRRGNGGLRGTSSWRGGLAGRRARERRCAGGVRAFDADAAIVYRADRAGYCVRAQGLSGVRSRSGAARHGSSRNLGERRDSEDGRRFSRSSERG